MARELGALTIGIVTKPFLFEGKKRLQAAEQGLAELKRAADTVIVVPNERLLSVVGKGTSFRAALKKADEVLLHATQGISDLITVPGLINLDFADVRTIMSGAGSALMGIGRATGEDRAVKAARAAISSPLLEASIEGAKGILLNITGSSNLGLLEVNEAAEVVAEASDPEANIIFGAVIDDSLQDEVRVTVIATGFDRPKPKDQFDFISGALGGEAYTGKTASRGVREPVREQPVDYQVRTFQRDDLDIPAFLRRQRANNGR